MSFKAIPPSSGSFGTEIGAKYVMDSLSIVFICVLGRVQFQKVNLKINQMEKVEGYWHLKCI